MSKRFFSTLLVLSLALTAPFAVAQEKANEAAKGPRLTIVEPIKDFGVVPKGQKLDWSFEIRNTGTSDLEILAAKPGFAPIADEIERFFLLSRTVFFDASARAGIEGEPLAWLRQFCRRCRDCERGLK